MAIQTFKNIGNESNIVTPFLILVDNSSLKHEANTLIEDFRAILIDLANYSAVLPQ